MAKKAFKTAVLGAVGAACVMAASPARADETSDRYDDAGDRPSRRDRGPGKTHIAFDFDFGSALDAPGTNSGGGGALRLGRKFDLLLISLTPEFGGSYHAFAGDERTKIYSGFLGGRLGVGKILEPSIFGHVGVGHVSGWQTRTAPVMDGGLALDFTLLPLIDLGVHGAYNVLLPTNDEAAVKYVTLGAQAAIVL